MDILIFLISVNFLHYIINWCNIYNKYSFIQFKCDYLVVYVFWGHIHQFFSWWIWKRYRCDVWWYFIQNISQQHLLIIFFHPSIFVPSLIMSQHIVQISPSKGTPYHGRCLRGFEGEQWWCWAWRYSYIFWSVITWLNSGSTLNVSRVPVLQRISLHLNMTSKWIYSIVYKTWHSAHYLADTYFFCFSTSFVDCW